MRERVKFGQMRERRRGSERMKQVWEQRKANQSRRF